MLLVSSLDSGAETTAWPSRAAHGLDSASLAQWLVATQHGTEHGWHWLHRMLSRQSASRIVYPAANRGPHRFSFLQLGVHGHVSAGVHNLTRTGARLPCSRRPAATTRCRYAPGHAQEHRRGQHEWRLHSRRPAVAVQWHCIHPWSQNFLFFCPTFDKCSGYRCWPASKCARPSASQPATACPSGRTATGGRPGRWEEGVVCMCVGMNRSEHMIVRTARCRHLTCAALKQDGLEP